MKVEMRLAPESRFFFVVNRPMPSASVVEIAGVAGIRYSFPVEKFRKEAKAPPGLRSRQGHPWAEPPLPRLSLSHFPQRRASRRSIGRRPLRTIWPEMAGFFRWKCFFPLLEFAFKTLNLKEDARSDGKLRLKNPASRLRLPCIGLLDSGMKKSVNPRSHIFISYARSDGELFAREIHGRLEEEEHLTCWRDRLDLEGERASGDSSKPVFRQLDGRLSC